MTKIYIFNPAVKQGGTTNLLTNLALVAGKTSGVELYLIDYEFGEAVTELSKHSISFTHIRYAEKNKIDIDGGFFIAILLHTKLIIEGTIVCSERTRILLWSTHPQDGLKIIPSFNLFLKFNSDFVQKLIVSCLHPFYYKRLKEFFQLATSNSSIIFMDDTNYSFNKIFFGFKAQKVIWPLITANPTCSKSWNDYHDSEVRLTFLGRIVDFKYYPILAFLMQLREIPLRFKLTFIGDGSYKEKLLEDVIKLGFIDFEFLGNVYKPDLDKVLSESDVCVAMGTSALESAKLKIPTLVLPYSYRSINHKVLRIKWLNLVNGVEVGEQFISNRIDGYDDYINDLFTSLTDRKKLMDLGLLCYTKWESDFSPLKIKKLLVHNLETNKFFFTDNVRKLLAPDTMSRFITFTKKGLKYFLSHE